MLFYLALPIPATTYLNLSCFFPTDKWVPNTFPPITDINFTLTGESIKPNWIGKLVHLLCMHIARVVKAIYTFYFLFIPHMLFLCWVFAFLLLVLAQQSILTLVYLWKVLLILRWSRTESLKDYWSSSTNTHSYIWTQHVPFEPNNV